MGAFNGNQVGSFRFSSADVALDTVYGATDGTADGVAISFLPWSGQSVFATVSVRWRGHPGHVCACGERLQSWPVQLTPWRRHLCFRCRLHLHPPFAHHGRSRWRGLTITGNTADNYIHVHLNGAGNYRVDADAQAPMVFTFGLVNSIVIDAGDGADTVLIGSDINKPATIHGGTGNDTITSGSGDDSICGDAGDDVLLGRPAAMSSTAVAATTPSPAARATTCSSAMKVTTSSSAAVARTSSSAVPATTPSPAAVARMCSSAAPAGLHHRR